MDWGAPEDEIPALEELAREYPDVSMLEWRLLVIEVVSAGLAEPGGLAAQVEAWLLEAERRIRLADARGRGPMGISPSRVYRGDEREGA